MRVFSSVDTYKLMRLLNKMRMPFILAVIFGLAVILYGWFWLVGWITGYMNYFGA